MRVNKISIRSHFSTHRDPVELYFAAKQITIFTPPFMYRVHTGPPYFERVWECQVSTEEKMNKQRSINKKELRTFAMNIGVLRPTLVSSTHCSLQKIQNKLLFFLSCLSF